MQRPSLLRDSLLFWRAHRVVCASRIQSDAHYGRYRRRCQRRRPRRCGSERDSYAQVSIRNPGLPCLRGRGEVPDILTRGVRSMNRLRITLFAVLFLGPVFLLTTPPAFSQTITTADVVGVVSDTSGAVVPGAKVTIKSLESGESRTETTNAEGQYRFPLMKPGDYEISADSKGLKSNLIKVTLLVGQAQEANITMNPAGTSTTVEVNATAAVLQTENANLETNFNKTQ